MEGWRDRRSEGQRKREKMEKRSHSNKTGENLINTETCMVTDRRTDRQTKTDGYTHSIMMTIPMGPALVYPTPPVLLLGPDDTLFTSLPSTSIFCV